MSGADPYGDIAAPISQADPYAGLGAEQPQGAVQWHEARSPTGKKAKFALPADATDDEIKAASRKALGVPDATNVDVRHGGETQSDTSSLRALALGALKPVDNAAAWLDAIPGVHQVGDAIAHATGLPTTEEANASRDQARSVNTRKGFQTLGNIAGVTPLSVIPGALTFNGLALTGMAGGALTSRDPYDGHQVALDAGVGGVGGVIGGKVVAPSISTFLRGQVGLAKYAGQTLAGLAGRGVSTATPNGITAGTSRAVPILLKALAAQDGGVEGSIARVSDARARGVPLGLMDSGDEARGLAGSLSRAPGDSRTIIRDAVVPRQDAQIDRITGTIKRDLGPVANVRDQSETLIAQARTAAAPLYEKAYAAPSRTSETLEGLLNTPAGKQAIARARVIAANEQRDPLKMGFDLDDQGETVLTKNPSMQTLDYVKRGLDDVVESHRDTTTGRLVLDEAGRAINGVRAKFLTEVDQLNPDYKAARTAYAGPAAMTTALSKGAKIGTKDAETLVAETRDLSQPELDQYRLGVRSALVKQLEARVDGSDKVKALIGSPKKRAALAQLFGGEEKFGRFMSTLGDEGQATQTYGRVNTGSMTAANQADDGHLAGVAGVAVRAGERAVMGHGMTSNAIRTLADLYRYGAGEAGAAVRTDLARTISNTDPAQLEAFRAAAKAVEQRRLGDLARTNTVRRGAVPLAVGARQLGQ